MASQIETLAAIICGAPRIQVNALLTETYIMISDDSLNTETSINSVINDMSAYSDAQPASVSALTFEIVDTINNVYQTQKPEVLSANMTTHSGSVTLQTLIPPNNVYQTQKPEVLSANMTTHSGSVTLQTLIPPNDIIQTQKPEILEANMTTHSGSVTVTAV